MIKTHRGRDSGVGSSANDTRVVKYLTTRWVAKRTNSFLLQFGLHGSSQVIGNHALLSVFVDLEQRCMSALDHKLKRKRRTSLQGFLSMGAMSQLGTSGDVSKIIESNSQSSSVHIDACIILFSLVNAKWRKLFTSAEGGLRTHSAPQAWYSWSFSFEWGIVGALGSGK